MLVARTIREAVITKGSFPLSHAVEPSIADGLLLDVVDHLTEHGVGAVSLRSLARALDVSTFKLLYHFGTKEELLRAAIRAAVEREISEVQSWLAESPSPTVGSIMKRYWSWFCRPRNQAVSRLLFEIHGLALRDPERYPDILRDLLARGVEVEREIIARLGGGGGSAEPFATLACAATWGLQLDLLNTGEVERTTAAYHRLADLLDEQIGTHHDPAGPFHA